jgi:hypothetical protein
LLALIDKEQLAGKLELRAREVVSHAQQQGFAVACFRGRILWDEAAVDQWLGETPRRWLGQNRRGQLCGSIS